MSKTVIGFYPSPQDARAALDALEQSDLRFDRVLVQTGAELFERLRAAHSSDTPDTWRGAREQLFQEYGGEPACARLVGGNDGVLMVVVTDEHADDTAAFLDEHGALDIDTRGGRLTESGDVRRASGLAPRHGGRTPTETESNQSQLGDPAQRDKRRSDTELRSRQTCARVFNV